MPTNFSVQWWAQPTLQERPPMTRSLLISLVVVLACISLIGCGPSGTPPVQTYQVPAPDPIARAKTILTNYANGMPVTSEADSFPDLVAKVKEKDPAKGEILDKSLSEIKANPASAQSKAKE